MVPTPNRPFWAGLTTRWDVALAVALAAAAAAESAATGGEDVAWRVVLSACAGLALLVRRTQPLVSAMLVASSVAVESLVAEPPDEMAVLLALLLSAFAVAAWSEVKETVAGLAFLALAVSLAISRDPSDTLSNIAPTIALFVALPGGLGLAFRRRGRDLAELQTKAAELELKAEAAAQAERDRLARELHDVVSHAVTLIAVQAEAGQAVIDHDLEGARSALEAIGGASRDALAELTALLAVLRSDEEARRPQGLHALTALVEGARTAGVRVECDSTVDVSRLPHEVDQCAYRIVQESLTNALRHSREPHVAVTIEQRPSALDIAVVSRGAHHRSRYGGTGRGLVGLRQRVAELGGTLEAGSRDGGFTVEASLPVASR